uniref:Uncharacterized protein n=1 Tax=Oryza sativa subsp. japonica TaxID=39947 RepID=Q6Z3B6_ORYSJ|nr:hypothetical protein [Oryza sativa Japonica Group]
MAAWRSAAVGEGERGERGGAEAGSGGWGRKRGPAATEAIGAKEAATRVSDVDCFSLLMPNGLLLLLLARPSNKTKQELMATSKAESIEY